MFLRCWHIYRVNADGSWGLNDGDSYMVNVDAVERFWQCCDGAVGVSTRSGNTVYAPGSVDEILSAMRLGRGRYLGLFYG